MAISRSLGGTPLTTRSSILISPELTLSRPAIMASKVDFPQPDGPTSTTNSPVLTSRLTPFRTAVVPKDLLRSRIVREAIVDLLFDGPLRQPAQKIPAAKNIDQERRQSPNQHGSAFDIVLTHSGSTRAEGDQRRRDRLVGARGKNDGEEKLVPDVGELPNHGDNHDGGRQWQHDLPKNPPESGAIDARRLDEIVGNIDVIVAEEEGRETQSLHTVDKHQTGSGIGQPEPTQYASPGQENHLAWHEDAEGHDAKK